MSNSQLAIHAFTAMTANCDDDGVLYIKPFIVNLLNDEAEAVRNLIDEKKQPDEWALEVMAGLCVEYVRVGNATTYRGVLSHKGNMCSRAFCWAIKALCNKGYRTPQEGANAIDAFAKIVSEAG